MKQGIKLKCRSCGHTTPYTNGNKERCVNCGKRYKDKIREE